jgi:hypothetical protein
MVPVVTEMAPDADLEEIEMKAWTSTHQDGLLELVVGWIMLVSVYASTVDALGISDTIRIATYVPMMFLGAPIIFFGKMRVTIPRIGLVKFGKKRERGMMKVALVMTASIAILLALTITAPVRDRTGFELPPIAGSILVTMIIITVFGVLAYVHDYPRLFVVGLLMGAGEPIAFVLRDQYQFYGLIAFGIPAIIVLAMGIGTLREFMRKYPLPSEEASNAAE